GFREEKGAREAVHVVPTPEQLLRCLGLGCAGKEAGLRIGAVQGIKIAHELREQLLMRHSLVSLRLGVSSTVCCGAHGVRVARAARADTRMLGQELRASYALAYQTGDALPLVSQFSLGTRSAGAV